MDGDGIEHDWANLNPAASSMKEMSEGSHHDTIDDLFGDWNYHKILGLGKYN
jgi:Kyakuja-Dileera-Zisupton transposase